MADVIDRLRTALADRYAIERELGSGGMATVYLAHDLRHDRQVAVKVLKPDLAAAIGSERFLREIRITAKLNHPHILPLLDSGEAAGFLYYALPFIAGGSLRKRLKGDGLPLDVVVRTAQQVAAALDHAHHLGVIHRDVKPENILFSEGLAVVADFGIAKAVSTASLEALTRSGFPLGTPGYMSPEQATGKTDLDASTDVCGLGCVVYEMLIGGTPGVWSTPDEVRVGRFLELPQGHRERLDRLPGRVEQVLVRALAIRPSGRFPKPIEFADALAEAAGGTSKLRDSEVRAVLDRAAEIEVQQPTEGALSVGAVEQVAAEVGIAPQRVRQAVEEMEAPHAHGAALHGQLQSLPTRFHKEKLLLDRYVSGVVATSQHAALVEEIQSTLGIVGHVSTVGESLTWSPAAPGTESRKLVITVTSQSDKTHIHVEERFELSGWRLFAPGWGAAAGGLAGAGLAALFGLGDPAIVVPALIGAFGGGFFMANAMIRVPASRRRPQLERLADRLAALVDSTEEKP
ncbi:MAG: serine/threonine protein kinase [Gemmatimonadota bacterium]|nr:MAG: serine/threonine protein kinase [Gemmatimonadota bacterium]